MEALEGPQDTQRHKEEMLEQGWLERKSRKIQTYEWEGANVSANEVPMLCNAGTKKDQLGCNALLKD